MKKVFLLLASLFVSSSLFAGVVTDNAFWVIKDGKIADGINYMPYDDLGKKIPNELNDTIVDGEPMVVYKQLSGDFLDVRLLFDNAVDLSKNYVFYLEYKIPATHAETAICDGNKPLFMFGLSTSEDNLKDKNAPHSDAYIFIDAKWGKTEEWVTVTRYIFANPSVESLAGMIVSYAREYKPGIKGDLTEFPYIKNMGFVALDEGKAFYAENFDGYGMGEFYNEKLDISNANPKRQTEYQGGIKAVVTEDDIEFADDNGRPSLVAFRDFLPDSIADQDGSGYIDCEILHALQIETNRRDSVVIPGIAIPEGCSKIYAQLLAKKHKNEKKNWPDADYSEVADMDMPIKLQFNTGEIVDLASDTIKLIWTKFKGEVDVPAGATSADLIFCSMPMGYLVDEILLTAAEFNSVADFMAKNNAFEVEAYINNNGEVVVLNGKLQAIYNMEGRLASVKDKVIIILVKNDEGKLSSKVLVRK